MRKSYSKFTLEQINTDFNIKLKDDVGFFLAANEYEINPYLVKMLEQNLPLAIAIGTEKAKSELLVSPILTELRQICNQEISLFSGIEFNVEAEKGLKGVCDFLISASSQQYYIDAPIIAMVEAKDDDIKGGLAQCLAEMIAAQIFNERKNVKIKTIYGVITTGSIWSFVRLEDKTAFVDSKEYSIENPHKIMGILMSMVGK